MGKFTYGRKAIQSENHVSCVSFKRSFKRFMARIVSVVLKLHRLPNFPTTFLLNKCMHRFICLIRIQINGPTLSIRIQNIETE